MFYFYKYIKPGWYFFLKPSTKHPNFFFDINDLPENVRSFVEIDSNYETEIAKRWDIAFQFFQKGLIDQSNTNSSLQKKVHSLNDNYVFLRKYYKPFWSWFVVINRIFSFNNPFSEIKSFINAMEVERINLYEELIPYCMFEINQNLNALKLKSISVIIATLNRYECLFQVLKALEFQTLKVSEVIIVDQSEKFNANFYNQFNLPLKVVQQKSKGQWTARNSAIKKAKGELIAFCDDDVKIEKDWVEQHLKALHYFSADISTGVFYFENSGIPMEKRNFKYAEQFSSNNAMVERFVFQEIGLFDTQYDGLRWGDGEFGLRAYLAGFKCISNPKASCVDLKVHFGGLREGGSWDAYKPAKFWGIRPIPSIFYFYNKYFPVSHLITDLQVKLPLSFASARKDNTSLEKVKSVLVFLFMAPFLTYSIIKSWRIGKKMSKGGAKIDKLE